MTRTGNDGSLDIDGSGSGLLTLTLRLFPPLTVAAAVGVCVAVHLPASYGGEELNSFGHGHIGRDTDRHTGSFNDRLVLLA